ncbi:hypothetical protein [Kordiimonas marina]|uniref:hypothetical protein n=1 Tax=Kordiimonas marina TaxID=2872312 RepID=UPI001FF2469B|nr:hypothetical protein [Kordiimonas marina]MCJ9429370.1 hypothetical protein [Kordiimonas marina]
MKLTKWLGALTLVALSWSAHADGGLTVINADSKAYVLVVEDSQEKTWEVQVDASATVSNICSNCYVSIKGQEDFEYADATTVIRIVEGKLQVQGQE